MVTIDAIKGSVPALQKLPGMITKIPDLDTIHEVVKSAVQAILPPDILTTANVKAAIQEAISSALPRDLVTASELDRSVQHAVGAALRERMPDVGESRSACDVGDPRTTSSPSLLHGVRVSTAPPKAMMYVFRHFHAFRLLPFTRSWKKHACIPTTMTTLWRFRRMSK